jgi:AcrR family transcriptional regulator
MSNKRPPNVRKSAESDPRVQRSVRALGAALVELMHEQAFDSITVQDILRRAGVGRATFYSHYRNKEDVLYSNFETFFGRLERALEASRAPTPRVAPVAEFLSHIGAVDRFVRALRDAGRLQATHSLIVDFFASMIERRIALAKDSRPGVPPALVARMLASALMEMVQWSVDRAKSSDAAQFDETFHEMARTTLARSGYVIRRTPLAE